MNLYEYEKLVGGLVPRRIKTRRWACPRCKWGVAEKGELCEFCKREEDARRDEQDAKSQLRYGG